MTDVTVETVDGVSIITLNAPERRNALTVEMCDAIGATGRNPAVSALLVATAGRAFCSGADLAVLRHAMPDPVGDTA